MSHEWKLIPSEPTEEMIQAWQDCCAGEADEASPESIKRAYAALLSAAPSDKFRELRKFKHTRGPWVMGADLTGIITDYRDASGNCTKDNLTRNGYAKTICKITHAPFATIEEHVANGHLISAATDLLNAALLIVDWLGPNLFSEFDINARRAAEAQMKLRAAISKATTP